jgi:hypothetical protein
MLKVSKEIAKLKLERKNRPIEEEQLEEILPIEEQLEEILHNNSISFKPYGLPYSL